MTHTDTTIATTGGKVAGTREDGVVVFRGVPYAAPPVGDLRWRPSQPHTGWSGVRDASRHGAVCPQPANVPWGWVQGTLGRDVSHADEDCLTLTITTPAVDGAPRPVVVYIHGGGNIVGAGSWDVFSLASFAQAGGTVGVGVNYRFASFGYLLAEEDGRERGNWWLDDQLAALAWVQENIAAFGGDPDRVTVVGHSGGAASIAAIMGLPASKGLFRRAALMGLPLGHSPYNADRARELTHRFYELLGVASLEEARKVPADKLVAAEPQLTAEASGWHQWHPGFSMVLDGTTLATAPREALLDNHAPTEVELLIGWTREEYAMAAMPNVSLRGVSRERVLERLEVTFGRGAETAYRFYASRRPGGLPVNVLVDALSDERYRQGCIDLAEMWAEGPRPAFAYQLAWQTRLLDGLFGAPHCLDIPFALNTLDAWRDGAMWDGTDPRRRQALADAMHAAWTAFVHDGDPNHEALPTWRPYTTEDHTVMSFDTVCQSIDGLVDDARELWTQLDGRQS